MELSDCEMQPGSWPVLKTLDLQRNQLTQIPSGLSRLSSLTRLSLEDQSADLQIVQPMHFLTQLPQLRKVKLAQAQDRELSLDGEVHAWNEGSLFALMQARLLIASLPGCQVVLED